jgi:hypothetical protein
VRGRLVDSRRRGVREPSVFEAKSRPRPRQLKSGSVRKTGTGVWELFEFLELALRGVGPLAVRVKTPERPESVARRGERVLKKESLGARRPPGRARISGRSPKTGRRSALSLAAELALILRTSRKRNPAMKHCPLHQRRKGAHLRNSRMCGVAGANLAPWPESRVARRAWTWHVVCTVTRPTTSRNDGSSLVRKPWGRWIPREADEGERATAEVLHGEFHDHS